MCNITQSLSGKDYSQQPLKRFCIFLDQVKRTRDAFRSWGWPNCGGCICVPLRLHVCDNLCAIWWIAREEVWNLALFFFMDLSHYDTSLFSWTYQTFCAFERLNLYLRICLFEKTNPPENENNTRLTTPVLLWHQLLWSPAKCTRKIERYRKVKVKTLSSLTDCLEW